MTFGEGDHAMLFRYQINCNHGFKNCSVHSNGYMFNGRTFVSTLINDTAQNTILQLHSLSLVRTW